MERVKTISCVLCRFKNKNNMNKNDSLSNAISSVIQFTDIDYVIVISLLLISLAIGVFIAFWHNGKRTTDDFLFGNFKMKCVPVALSLMAR